MMIVGVDPGVSGALCLYNPESMSVNVLDMPTVWVELKKKDKNGKPCKRRKINYKRLAMYLHEWGKRGAQTLWLEKVGGMPGDGVIQAFSFGESVGAVKGVATTLGYTIHEVTPQQWKKRFDLIGTDKQASVDLASNLFGAYLFKLKKDHGKSDACLIAAFGADFGKK